MSRSSSVSTKDRAGQTKRSKPPKQRRDDSDSFDVRSMYTPIFPQQQVPGPTWAPNPQYPPLGVQQPFVTGVQNAYSVGNSQFVPQTQHYNPAMMNNGSMPGYANVPQQVNTSIASALIPLANHFLQFPQPNQQRFPPHSAPITTYGSPVQTPPMPPQQWQQQQIYPTTYQQGPVPRGPPNSIPYAFGQLPSTANPADPKSQHPIPGSFNRHAFNPKTQSFVPGSTNQPAPQPMSHHGSPHHGSPHHGSPHLTYNAFAPPPQQYGTTIGYGMARQGSNNSLPSYHASPHMASRPMMHQAMPHNLPQGGPQMTLGIGQQQGMQHISQGITQNGQVGNHLPHYGNPSTLPPKPPTGV